MDPNRYIRNRNIKPETPFKTFKSIASLVLMLLGLIGLAVTFFGPNAGLTKLIDALLSSGLYLFLTAIAAFGLFKFHHYISKFDDEGHKKAGDFPLFLMMIIGAIFVFRLIFTGGF